MRVTSNATELYIAMYDAISTEQWMRQVCDPESPQVAPTYEARPGSEFELRFPEHNVQIAVPMDPKWAIANTLHFFAGTEEAAVLLKYNKHAPRFLTGDK